VKKLPLILLLAWLVGNAVLLKSLKGGVWALQLLAQDPDGSAFETPPDDRGVAHAGDLAIDYLVPREPTPGLGAATGGDRGLDDVREAIRWVRLHLRTGRFFWITPWHIADVLRAAEDPNRKFFCGSYSRMLAAACISRGYPARVVEMNGHIESEVYLPAVGHWVLADALYDFIAFRPGGEPLSLVQTARRLLRGEPVEWRPVTGQQGDDDDMDPKNQAQVERIIRKGDFVTADGATTFGRLSRAERARDVLLCRVRMVQAGLQRQPPKDGIERRLRVSLLGWNLVAITFQLAMLAWPATGAKREPLPAPDGAAPEGGPAS
jgi:hypothetical protein